MTSTGTGEQGAIPSESQSVLTQESLVGKLPTPISDVVCHALAQSLCLLRDMSVAENSRVDEFVAMKKENAYEMDKKKQKTELPEKEVTMKAMATSVVDFESTVNCLETKGSFLMKTSKQLVS